MKFDYAWYAVDPSATAYGSTDLYRPEILIRVIGNSGGAFVLGLLDTGADEVLVPRSLAEMIGADLDESLQWSIGGFAGQTETAVLGRIEIEITDGTEAFRWKSAIGVVTYPDPEQEQLVVLGHAGFLQYFNMEFRGEDHEVILLPNATYPPP